MRSTRPWLLLLLSIALCACGGKPAEEPTTTPDPAPATPEAALAWVREAAAADDTDLLRRRLAAWPLKSDAFHEADETQVALTWRVRLALQDGDIEAAVAALGALRERFEGEGISPEGRTLSSEVLTAGVFEEALARARDLVEGGRADSAKAQRALEVAATLLEPSGPGDHDAWIALEKVRRWVDLAQVNELPFVWRPQIEDPPGPRVLVFADDFTLGEAVFAGVLERWQRDGRDGGLRVRVVPVIRGQVRMGLRRVPAESEEAEVAAIRARCESIGVTLIGRWKERVRDQLNFWWGLGPQDVAILVLDAKGRIVGRLSGTNLDPRPLDSIVQKLTSR